MSQRLFRRLPTGSPTVMLAAVLFATAVPSLARAGDGDRWWQRWFVCAESPVGSVDRHARAGGADRIGRHAAPSVTRRYQFGLVGGGAVVRGEPARHSEGTWGLDYSGGLFQRRIWLGWWHGRRAQDGGGSYTTDGPKPLEQLRESLHHHREE